MTCKRPKMDTNDSGTTKSVISTIAKFTQPRSVSGEKPLLDQCLRCLPSENIIYNYSLL